MLQQLITVRHRIDLESAVFKKVAIFVVMYLIMLGNQAMSQNKSYIEPIYVNPDDERLILDENVQLSILVEKTISSKNPGEVKAVIASDVVLNGEVIIPKGERVLLTLGVDGPKRLSVAVLTLDFEAVQTMTGTEVSIAKRLQAKGLPSCLSLDCVLYLPWRKGSHAKIPAGTLIGTHVSQRVEIPAAKARSASSLLIDARNKALTRNSSKVFVYLLDDCCNVLKVDHRRAALLDPEKWVCFDLTVGRHILHVDKQQFFLDVKPGETYYLNLVSRERRLVEILQTNGFVLDDHTLRFSAVTRQFKTSCW